MKSDRLACLVSLTVMLVFALACSSVPPYHLTQTSPQNFVRGVTRVHVRPIVTTGIVVNGTPEAQFIASRTPEQLSAWETDKATLAERLEAGFADANRSLVAGRYTFETSSAAPSLGALAVEFRVASIDSNWLEADASVSDASGGVEQVHFRVSPNTPGVFALGQKVRQGTWMMGHNFVMYLRDRSSGSGS